MRTGDVKEIQLKGLSSTRNDYECADGELQVCHNAVNTGDGLRPIQQAETIEELPAGWVGLVFVHHTSQGDIYIMVDGDGNAWWKKKGDEGNGTGITEPGTGLFAEGEYQITSVGDVMVVNFKSKESGGTSGSTAGLHYYRWKDGGYKYIGQSPPDAGLEFALALYYGTVGSDGGTEPGDGYIASNTTRNIWIKFRADTEFSAAMSYEEAFSDYPSWLDELLGRMNSLKAELRGHGLFTGRFFIRTAYRLYDGTYMMQGSPVLMAGSMEENPMIWPYDTNERLKEDPDGGKYWEIEVKARLLYRPFVLCARTLMTAEAKQRLKEWEDVIDRVCVFVTPEMQSYTEDPKYMVLKRKEKLAHTGGGPIIGDGTTDGDGTMIDGKTPIEIAGDVKAEAWRKGAYITRIGFTNSVNKYHGGPAQNTGTGWLVPEADDAWEDMSAAAIRGEQVVTWGRNFSQDHWSAVLKHCQDVSLEDWNNAADHPDESVEMVRRMLAEFGGWMHTVEFEPKPGTEEEQMLQEYLFYPLKEYTIEEACALGGRKDGETDVFDGTMEWPYMAVNTASDMWPRKGEEVTAPQNWSFVKFGKDRLENLQVRADTLTDDYQSWQRQAAGVIHTYNGRLNAANVTATFKDVPWQWMGGAVLSSTGGAVWRGRVLIETEGRTVAAELPDTASAELPQYEPGMNCGWIYYPHPDAKKIEIITQDDVTGEWKKYEFKLKTHPYLHGAYFYAKDFDTGMGAYFTGRYGTVEDALPSVDAGLAHPNRMLTSEVDNPFFFPAEGVNTIGSGEITAVKSASKAMSEGTAFGATPLYVFATDGVWPLSVGGTGLFVATNPPTRETLLNNDPNAALQIDNAIVFLSERGLMLLTGERTTLLSGDLSERFSTLNVKDLPKWQEIMTAPTPTLPDREGDCNFMEADDFMSFIKQGARMAFDYVNYRIIVFRPYNEADKETHTAFIYDIGSKMWGTMDCTLTSSVEGYPQSLVNMTGTRGVTIIGQYGANGDTLVGDGKMLYTTRPMKLEKPDVMKTVRTLIERSVSHGGAKYLGLWGSRDMVNWVLIGAVQGGRMPRISGTPYKYFIVGGWSRLDINGDAISRLTIEEKDKYIDKLR